MITVLKTMQMRKNKIPEEILPVFENIIKTFEGNECEAKFMKAMEEHLTKERRFRIWEQNGGCKGTGYDKKRKSFALEHAEKPLLERLKLFNRHAFLNADNTITLPFACKHGYYKHAPLGKFQYPESIQTYFEKCAGGRLYGLQKALGIKLKIKSVDISPLSENIINPVVFTFEIVE